jgi:hypothetical protein
VTNDGIPEHVDIAMAGPFVIAVGTNGWPPTYHVNTSTDGGATWHPTPLLLPSPAIFNPRAIARPGELLVHWPIVGSSGSAIRTIDAGASWHNIPGPVQGGFHAGDRRTLHVEVSPFPPVQFARYHAYVGVGSTRLGAGTAGTGGLVPELSSTGLPVVGGTTTLHVDGTVGGTIAAIGLSLSPPTAIPFVGGTVHLASLDLLQALTTGGASGQSGAGHCSLPLTIPSTLPLLGTHLVAQGLAVDAAASGSLALTNALEIWLR